MNRQDSHWPLTLLGGAVSLLNMVLPLLLVRILNPTDIGHYKIYFLYLQIAPAFALVGGIMSGLSHWGGNNTKRINAFRSSWGILLIVATLILVTGLIFRAPLGRALEWNPVFIQLLVIGVWATLLGGFFEEVSIASGKIVRGAVFNASFDFLRNFAMAYAAWRYRAIEPVLWAHILALIAKLAVGSVWGAIEGFQRPSFNLEAVMAVVRYAFPVSISIMLGVAASYIDQVLLSRILDPDHFAIYTLGCLGIPFISIFETSVNRVLIPKMSNAFVSGQSELARSYFREAVSELSWLLLPATVGLILFSNPIITLLFTSRFSEAAPFLRLYALTYLVLMLPHDSVARARADGTWILRWLAGYSFCSVLAVGFMAVHFGAIGALVSMVVTRGLMRVGAIISVSRNEHWSLRKMLPFRDWAAYLIHAVAASFMAWLIRTWFSGTTWLVIGGMTFALVYFAGTLPRYRRRIKQSELPVAQL